MTSIPSEQHTGIAAAGDAALWVAVVHRALLDAVGGASKPDERFEARRWWTRDHADRDAVALAAGFDPEILTVLGRRLEAAGWSMSGAGLSALPHSRGAAPQADDPPSWREHRDTVMTLVKALHTRGEPLARIAAELDRRGLPTAKRGHWHATTVKRLLRKAA